MQLFHGPNGLLNQAEEAKTATEKANVKETIQTQVLGSFDSTGEINTEKLNENLGSISGLLYNGKQVDKDDNPISLPVDVVLDGYTANIDENGIVTIEGEKKAESSSNNTQDDIINLGSCVLVFNVTARDAKEPENAVYSDILTYSYPIESEEISQNIVISKSDLGNISNDTEVTVTCIYNGPSFEVTSGQEITKSFNDGQEKLEFSFDFEYNDSATIGEGKTISYDFGQ